MSSWLWTTLDTRNDVEGFQAGGGGMIRFGFLRSVAFEVTCFLRSQSTGLECFGHLSLIETVIASRFLLLP